MYGEQVATFSAYKSFYYKDYESAIPKKVTVEVTQKSLKKKMALIAQNTKVVRGVVTTQSQYKV